MDIKKVIAPEAKQALVDFKLEMADELGIHTYNNMTKSEYPVNMNILDSKNKNPNKKFYNHDIY